MNSSAATDRVDRWQLHAACRGRTALFVTDDPLSIEIARRVCKTCPVKPQCGELADQLRADTGVALGAVWAGRRR